MKTQSKKQTAEEKIQNRKNILLGDAALRIGKLEEAISYYKLAGEKLPKSKIAEQIELLVEAGLVEEAIEYLKASGESITEDNMVNIYQKVIKATEYFQTETAFKVIKDRKKLIALGGMCMKEKYFDKAQDFFEKAKAQDRLIALAWLILKKGEYPWRTEQVLQKIDSKNIPQRLLLAFVEKMIQGDQVRTAHEWTRHLNAIVQKKKLLEIGQIYFEKEEVNSAIEVFRQCNAKKELIAVGNFCIKKGNLDVAKKAFRGTGHRVSKRKKLEQAKYCFEKGDMTGMIANYQLAGELPPKENFLALGKRFFLRGHYYGAFNAFKQAEELAPEDVLRDMAETLILIGKEKSKNVLAHGGQDQFMLAAKTLHIVGDKKRLVELAQICQDCRCYGAVVMYAMAEDKDRLTQFGHYMMRCKETQAAENVFAMVAQLEAGEPVDFLKYERGLGR